MQLCLGEQSKANILKYQLIIYLTSTLLLLLFGGRLVKVIFVFMFPWIKLGNLTSSASFRGVKQSPSPAHSSQISPFRTSGGLFPQRNAASDILLLMSSC